MNATLTVELDAATLRQAEREAAARNTTVPELVARQLKVMAQNWSDSQAGHTPVTDALRGVITLPDEADFRDRLTEEMRKKYGGEG